MNEADRAALELLRIELSGKLDRLLDAQRALTVKMEDHEQRLRAVERWKLSIPISMLLVAATIIGSIVTGLGR